MTSTSVLFGQLILIVQLWVRIVSFGSTQYIADEFWIGTDVVFSFAYGLYYKVFHERFGYYSWAMFLQFMIAINILGDGFWDCQHIVFLRFFARGLVLRNFHNWWY